MNWLKEQQKGFAALPHRRAWVLAWPMILSNMSVPLMGLADTAMLGHLDNAAPLAAVALGSSVVALLYWMFSFLRMGTTSQTGNASGAKDIDRLTGLLFQNGCFALGLGVTIIILQFWLVNGVLTLMSPDENLVSTAKDYCNIRLYSAPAVLATYVLTGWLIGLENTKATLVITVSANLLNIGLDYLFIVHWSFEAKGAAGATLIAEITALCIALVWARKTLREKGWHLRFEFDIQNVVSTLKLNRDLFIRTTTLLVVLNFFNAQGAYFGTHILAANAILFQFTLFASFFLDGYALAAETLTSQALGRKVLNEFFQACAVTAITAAIIALVLTLIFWVLGPIVLPLLSDIPKVLDSALTYLHWVIFMPLISVACYALDGIYIGAGKAKEMRNAMLFSAVFGFFLFWWMFRDYGNHGLWAALLAFNAMRGITLGIDYSYRSLNRQWLKAAPIQHKKTTT